MEQKTLDGSPVFSGVQGWDEIAGRYMRGAVTMLVSGDGFPVAEAARCLAWRFARHGERVTLVCRAEDVGRAQAAFAAAGAPSGGGALRVVGAGSVDPAVAAECTVVVVEPGAFSAEGCSGEEEAQAVRAFVRSFRRPGRPSLLVAMSSGPHLRSGYDLPFEHDFWHDFDLMVEVVADGTHALASVKNRNGVHDRWALPPGFPGEPAGWSGTSGGAP